MSLQIQDTPCVALQVSDGGGKAAAALQRPKAVNHGQTSDWKCYEDNACVSFRYRSGLFCGSRRLTKRVSYTEAEPRFKGDRNLLSSNTKQIK